jgi:hypothetical protein
MTATRMAGPGRTAAGKGWHPPTAGHDQGQHGPEEPRRAANGKVCGNTSPDPKANLPRGGPLPTGIETSRAVAKPAATSASPLSNTHELAGSRRTYRTAPSRT